MNMKWYNKYTYINYKLISLAIAYQFLAMNYDEFLQLEPLTLQKFCCKLDNMELLVPAQVRKIGCWIE